MKEHRFSLKVYYEDVDAGGVVYHANYLKFLERARSDVLHTKGTSNARIREEEGVLIVVHSLSIAYRRPALLEDDLCVVTRLATSERARVVLDQSIEKEGKELIRASVTLASVKEEGFRPVRFPASVVALFS